MGLGYGYVKEILDNRQPVSTFPKITIGEVVDTNDPQQMGRLRVVCPSLGDSNQSPLKNIPWASYMSPFGGMVDTGNRGRTDNEASGPTSYGMWNIPKVGSTVLIACIDGDPRFRIWMGCIYGQFLPHTMPHGRYIHDDNGDLVGPVSSTEDPIEPLHSEMTLAFTTSQDSTTIGLPTDSRKNYEFLTRGSDFMSASLDLDIINSDDSTVSLFPDDKGYVVENTDGTSFTVTQGYAESRIEPDLAFKSTNNKNYDPQTYNWTSPGLHSFSMDDRAENCRIRIRTTHGHQIIMDDTNERMYISTPQGDTWIELDEKGNIDIYGKRNISVHAEQDINMTAGKTFRVTAKEGIHLISDDEVRIHSKGGNGINMKSSTALFLSATDNINIRSAGSLMLKSIDDFHADVGGSSFITSVDHLNLLTGGTMYNTASIIHFNGPSASMAKSASSSKEAFVTSRVPEHEPWARVMTDPLVTDQDSGNTHTNSAEYKYNDANVGRIERGEDLNRNPNWRR